MENQSDRVRLDLTIEQADALVEGLDVASRLALGQIGEIATLVRMGRVMRRDDHADGGCRSATASEEDRIEDACRLIAAALGHGRGSFGIGSPGVGDVARRQHEIGKVVRKAVADHRDPGGFGTHHDGLTVRYARDPEPAATMIRKGEDA